MKSSLSLIPFCAFFSITFFSCQKGEVVDLNPSPVEHFIGQWDNIEAASVGLARVIITRKDEGQLSVDVWSHCQPNWCHWGPRFANIEEAENGVMELDWGQINYLTFQMTPSGKLEVLFQNPWDTTTYYFAKERSTSLYQQIELEDIDISSLSRALINAGSHAENQLKAGTIMVYKTDEGRYGKLQIRGNDVMVSFRRLTWDKDGSVFSELDYSVCRNNAFFDLDSDEWESSASTLPADFYMEIPAAGQRWLIPKNGAVFAIYHSEQ